MVMQRLQTFLVSRLLYSKRGHLAWQQVDSYFSHY